MRLNEFLRDATGSAPNASQRSQHIALTDALNGRYGNGSISLKGVEKWFSRQSIPGVWLMRIAALPKIKLNPANYA